LKIIQIKQIVKTICVALIILSILIIYMGCLGYKAHSNSSEFLLTMIKSDPSVLNAEISVADIRFFGRTWQWRNEYLIHIIFNDGKTIRVANVNDDGEGDENRMEIRSVNDYSASIVNKNTGIAIDIEQNLNFFSALTGVQLKTVMDIVKNYRIISGEVEKWPNLVDLRQDNEEIYETCERVFVNNLLSDSIIFFNGQEYIVYKSNLKQFYSGHAEGATRGIWPRRYNSYLNFLVYPACKTRYIWGRYV